MVPVQNFPELHAKVEQIIPRFLPTPAFHEPVILG